MSEFKGTKGKWIADIRTGCCAVYSKDRIGETNGLSPEDDRNIYYSNRDSFYNGNNWVMSEEAKANAQLISKAPEMLEMLDKVLDHLTPEFPESSQELLLDEIKQLIKEATKIE